MGILVHDADAEREWLIPLGNGGYSAATVTLRCARSYHGLLVGAFVQPIGRRVLLNSVSASFVSESGQRYSLGGACGAGMEEAKACLITVTPYAEWEFQAGGALVRLVIRPCGAGNQVALTWSMVSESRGQIELQPLFSGRSHHGGDVLDMAGWTTSSHQAMWCPEGAGFRVHLRTTGQLLMVDASQVVVPLPRESRRGLRDSETLDSVIRIEAPLSPSEPLQLVVADALISGWPVDDALPDLKRLDQSEVLRQAVMACVIRRPVDGAIGVLAGYHWFGEWGRDTMIALPGIGLATGDWALVADVLTQWTRRLSMGMLPNRLEVDGAEESHNSADASLWYARAVQCWYQATQDEDKLHEMFLPALHEIQRCYSSGTRYGIRVDPRDGLLTAGMEGVQLTWMDAKVGEWVVTPRRGKCVELNALFYSLCIFLGDHRAPLDGGPGDADTILDQARRLSQNFASVFWDETEGALSDCVGEGSMPYELRPNQLLALSAGDELLDRERALRALQRVEDELLTPFGLRTLDPSHPDYQGNCTGSPVERDGAYHQGTVWPWLLGPLADAQWALRQRVSIDFEPLMDSLQQGAIGHLSEIFDGDSPHTARGAIAQAWSASEVFRASQM